MPKHTNKHNQHLVEWMLGKSLVNVKFIDNSRSLISKDPPRNLILEFPAACRVDKAMGDSQGGELRFSPLSKHGDSFPVRSQNNLTVSIFLQYDRECDSAWGLRIIRSFPRRD
jgi:hypothetical protein